MHLQVHVYLLLLAAGVCVCACVCAHVLLLAADACMAAGACPFLIGTRGRQSLHKLQVAFYQSQRPSKHWLANKGTSVWKAYLEDIGHKSVKPQGVAGLDELKSGFH